jgi:murein DD-endopeptidase MepM/ murein hydrolase activator NlpD
LTSSADTLEALSARFKVSVATIRQLNDLEAEADLKEGQVVRIPLVDGPAHRVTPGDTLSQIAVRYGVEQQSVVDANALESDLILPGQVLLIPDGVPPTDPPTTPTAIPTVRAAATSTPRPRPSTTSTPTGRPTTMAAAAQPTAQSTPTRRATSTPPTVARAAAEPAGSARTDRPSFAWPVNGALSQHFGTNGHEGIDVAAPQGAIIRAAAAGRVTVAAKLSYGYGWRIKIDHGGGYTTLYAHLSSFAVAEGDRVGRGQVIGAVGRTGQATGPHLHFEVLLNGHPVDPLKQLP